MTNNHQWKEPIPLTSTSNEKSVIYPTDLLPDVIRCAVEEYQDYGQQPLPMVACSALANVSLACQGLANIARDEQLISPLSLYFIVVAESGERKTAADKIFTDCAKHWEQVARDGLKDEVKRNQADHDAWFAQRESILTAIKTPKYKADDIMELKHRLQMLDLNEPQKTLLPNLYHEETNAESLAYNLAIGWQSSSLWSDEAGIIVGGHGMNQDNVTKFITLLNRLWDGNTYRVSRKTTDCFTIEGRRLTCSLMMQPAIFEQLINRSGNVSRGVGFLARCLVVNPASTMGNRFYKPLPPNTPSIKIFHEHIQRLLNKPLPVDDKKRLTPKILQLSFDAKNTWIKFHDEVETELRACGEFGGISDFASKAADIAVRLAGNFHVFCEQDGDVVDNVTMSRAADIMRWHLPETKRLLGALEIPPEYKDAQLLLAWLKEKQCQEIKLTELLQFAPSSLRTKEKRDKAITVLRKHNYVMIEEKDNRQYLILNPSIWTNNEGV